MKPSVKGVFRRHKWLEQHFGKIKEIIPYATVERMDTAFLDQPTGHDTFEGMPRQGKVKVFLFNAKGDMISRVQYEKWYHLRDVFRYQWATSGWGGPDGRRVYEAMRDLGSRINECHYGVLVTPYWLTLYLPPGGHTVESLFTEYMEARNKKLFTKYMATRKN